MKEFTIHVGVPLSARWDESFNGAEIRALDDGSCVLIAHVQDQAALFGILLRIRDLGVPLQGVYPGWPAITLDGSTTDATELPPRPNYRFTTRRDP
jgi:hypothetical protein